jgi:proline iminopeptidase
MPSDPLSPGTHTFTAEDITFSYVVSGAGPLLAIQSVGWGPSSYMRNCLRLLESDFKLLYFEPRGNGSSTPPAIPSLIGTKTMAHDLESLRLHLAIPAFAILGHSNGGAIALTYAELFPSRVSKLILASHELQSTP